MTRALNTTHTLKNHLRQRKAVWISPDTLLWPRPVEQGSVCALVYSPGAALTVQDGQIRGGRALGLTLDPHGPGEAFWRENPHLAGWTAYTIAPADQAWIREALQAELAFVVQGENGHIRAAAGVQIAQVLDALYPYSGPLGVAFDGREVVLRVWAPTAQAVNLVRFAGPTGGPAELLAMALDRASGVWQVRGGADWQGSYYQFEVHVYVTATGRIECNRVTDPYSVSLSANSLRSQILDLRDEALQPAGWEALAKPALAGPEEIVIYELHLRDFSITDPSVPAALRGTFAAFTQAASHGMRHLAGLVAAGVTHLHLLPVFDIATLNEDRASWQALDQAALAALPPDSDRQAAAIQANRHKSGYNWGYDPYHYSVPEGSYACDPDGGPRIREFREMVAALNRAGLRVVMDVVYNHTTDAGQDPKSVLDKIVPGYYYRLSPEGELYTSTCCPNTASEHAMMEKLIVDSVLLWAKAHKVDGFRFDLMGHHMLRTMHAVRAALDGLTAARDGVDGRAIYVYGEGWDFGEVAGEARGINASQRNCAGSGIGSFNDRLRDGVRGGSPSGHPQEQGFCTGMYLAPNEFDRSDPVERLDLLSKQADWIRIGLAGNLRDYTFFLPDGQGVRGEEIDYKGQPAGYAAEPCETINYVAAHDNETLFDAVQLKAPRDLPLSERIRANHLALSFPMFAQGIPFFHAGDDILRSKSLDRNSFESEDWFNRLDWTLNDNNWGRGLPLEGREYWPVFRPLLADPALKPSSAEICQASAVFRELLRIRRSSPLFRLRSADQVQRCLRFIDVIGEQPGLIGMVLSDVDGLDSQFAELVVWFNANPGRVRARVPGCVGRVFQLHPLQQRSVDAVMRQAGYEAERGEFLIPGRSCAVFVCCRAD